MNLPASAWKRWRSRVFYVQDSCWPWTGTRDSKNYGVLKSKGRMVKAHRMAYVAAYGPIPSGLCVLHKCDNPPCCNPEHLFLGTLADNAADRDRKGRTNRPQGEKHPQAKLTDTAIRSIRRRSLKGETYKSIADSFGMHPATISEIARKKTWRHIA